MTVGALISISTIAAAEELARQRLVLVSVIRGHRVRAYVGMCCGMAYTEHEKGQTTK